MPSAPPASRPDGPFAGLDLLSSAVVMIDRALTIRYFNASAENLFAISRRRMLGAPIDHLLGPAPALQTALEHAGRAHWSYTGQDITVLRAGRAPLHLDCTVSPVDTAGISLLLEFRPIDARLRVEREEQLLRQQQANRELFRNLAHEIKNPLGGIRGSAQLLSDELAEPQLREYTDVIVAEVDRLQALMGRLLSVHSMLHPAPLNIHDVLERVRRLVLAEYPAIRIQRDYDPSLPELTADREQLIQAILNIARNAAQAMDGDGTLRLKTRAARQVTLAKRRFKLALEVHVIDSGPGIPSAIREQIFYPLVSGRQGGSGLGLSLAQSVVEQHHGMIDVSSRPGATCFTLVLPISEPARG